MIGDQVGDGVGGVGVVGVLGAAAGVSCQSANLPLYGAEFFVPKLQMIVRDKIFRR